MSAARARLDRAARMLASPPPEPVPGQLAVEVEQSTPTDKPPKVCEYGNPRCGAVPVRPYIGGLFCDTHPAGRRPTTPKEQ
jgi:hypothetical protein